MGLNLERVKQVVEELERHRKLIDDALETLTSLQKVFEGQTPLDLMPPDVPVKKETPANGKSNGAFACVKHPQSSEFSARGQCKLCHSEYMREYWSKKKKQKAVAEPDRSESETSDTDTADFVFCRRQRCPKCGLLTRFRREREAGPADHWLCLGAGCELKIANYKIGIDRDYEPEDDDAGTLVETSVR